MLRIENLRVSIAGAVIIDDVSLTLAEGTIGAIVGPNGAGKSTLVNAVSGLMPTATGSVSWAGRELVGLSTEDRVRAGVSHVLERRRLFPHMTVEENLRLGAYAHRHVRDVDRRLADVMNAIPLTRQRRRQRAGTMSGGQQQLVAIARGLMAEPQLLILDEPLLGLSPAASDEIVALLHRLRERHMTVLFIEQNIDVAFNLADTGFVLETGRLVMAGPAKDLLRDRRLQEVYLG